MKPPIPVPDPDAEALVFRCKFLHYWIATSFAGLAWSLPVLLVLYPTRNQQELLLIAGSGTVAGIICGGMTTILLIIIAPVKVDATRLRSTNFWSKSAQVQWQEISSVKRINYLTLPYIKISTPHKKNIIWLPLFLTDPHGFHDAVASFTPPDHPLRLALEKEFPK